VQLDHLITTKKMLHLDVLLAEDSTFYGDMFAHVVEWRGELYLEDGLHRAPCAARSRSARCCTPASCGSPTESCRSARVLGGDR
jgi:Arc/MetJ family transcription regulator